MDELEMMLYQAAWNEADAWDDLVNDPTTHIAWQVTYSAWHKAFDVVQKEHGYERAFSIAEQALSDRAYAIEQDERAAEDALLNALDNYEQRNDARIEQESD